MEREASSNNTGGGGGGGDDISAVKEMRQSLEARIESRHKEQEDLISSLQTLNIPELFSSLNLSLQLLSSFHRRPFQPLSPPPNPNPHKFKPHSHDDPHPRPPPSKKRLTQPNESSRRLDADPLSVVRDVVAVCLLERTPFSPTDSSSMLRKLESDTTSLTPAEKAALIEAGGEDGAIAAVQRALRTIAEENGGVELEELVVSGKTAVMVMGIDRNRLVRELPESKAALRQHFLLLESSSQPKEQQDGAWATGGGRGMVAMGMGMPPPHYMASPYDSVKQEEEELKEVAALVQKKSVKELEKEKTGTEICAVLSKATYLEQLIASRFKTKGGPQLQEYCLALTKEDCRHKSGSFLACEKVHFRRIIAPHTDVNLGDCSFLDTCRHMKTCKYVHYELDPTPDVPPTMMGNLAPPKPLKTQRAEYCSEVELGEPQWINCDIRNFRMDILGQFGVIMADPPWDIHMELPYGTMADDEMRTLNVPALQTDGLIFLWVTGRAMELGRECLELWGYKRVEEIIWVKTNQLQRIIRTGRTGHWLNHSKEHCLVGIKGNPEVNRNIDTDVIVAEVRETSRKPDEMYPLLERISPRTRKLELFARMNNTQAGWLSLGNQLAGVRLVDDGLRARFKAAYPAVEVQPPSPPRSSAMDVEPEVRTPFSGPEARAGPTPVTLPLVAETLPSQNAEMVS